MRVYYDEPSQNIVLGTLGRFFPKGSLIAYMNGTNISISYTNQNTNLVFAPFTQFQKEDGSPAGVDDLTTLAYLNSEFAKFNDITEEVQDIVGNALTDSSTVDFTYNDPAGTITAEVKDDSITNTKLANMPANTIKGNNTGVSGDPLDLTVSQVQALLGVIVQPATTIASATANTTTSSATPVVMTGMTLTPGAGTYQITFSTTLTSNSTNATVTVSVFANGVQQASSIRTAQPNATSGLLSNINIPIPISTNNQVTIAAGQSIDIRWQTTAGTATAAQRALTIIKIG